MTARTPADRLGRPGGPADHPGAFDDIAASTGLTKAGGYLGLLTAAVGAYLAMAELTNATFGRKVLPIHPLS
jgi:succinate-acetate transporter protein